MKEIVKKFIEDNNLYFTGIGSDLNGECVVLAGFCCYKELDNQAAEEIFNDLYHSTDAQLEFSRVMNYAIENSYGLWWRVAASHRMYKFD